MKKRTILGITMLGLIIFPTFLMAEFYRYKDKDGAIKYTDNLSEVPEDQRGSVEQYDESKIPENQKIEIPNELRPDKDSNLPVYEYNPNRVDTRFQQKEVPKDKIDKAKQWGELLQATKFRLDQEYDGLINEKKNLTDQKSNLDEADYKNKVEQINAKIRAYDKRLEKYSDELRDYNKLLKEVTN